MNHYRTAFTAASVSITALLLTSCGTTEDDEQPGAAESPQPTQTETETETAEPSPTPTDEDGEEGQDPEDENENGGLDDEGSEDESAPDGEEGSDDLAEDFNPEEFDTDSVDETTEDPSVVGELTEVRLGHHGDYERLVFEFTGDELPNDYPVSYTHLTLPTNREV